MERRERDPVTQWVEVDGIRRAQLATESLGQGQSFVWGHGLLGSMAQDLEGGVMAWRELTDIAQVIRFDARGHGRSELQGDPQDFRWDNLARSMWQVADSYTTEPVVLGGASMGCATALYAACQRPQEVRGLVLAIPPTAWEAREGMKRNYRAMAKFIEVSRALPMRLLQLVPQAKPGAGLRRTMLSSMAKHLAGVKPQGIVSAMRGASLSDLPSREALKKLQIPALILAWPDDNIHPLAVAEDLHSILPNSQLEVMRREEELYRWPQRVADFIKSLQ